MIDSAQQIITLLSAGLLMYFIQENIKTAKDANNSSQANGDRIGNVMAELQAAKLQIATVVQQLETHNMKVDMYQENLDTMFKFSNERHNELMEANQDMMKQQRSVINTVDLERARLDSFAESGIKMIKKFERTTEFVAKVDKQLARINSNIEEIESDIRNLEKKGSRGDSDD